MDHEPGEEYDCPVCGGTHVVERGKGLRVAGSSEGLDPAPYVRCPEAGVVPLGDGDGGDGDGGDDDATGVSREDDAEVTAADEADDWP